MGHWERRALEGLGMEIVSVGVKSCCGHGVPPRAGEWGSSISHRVIVTIVSPDQGTPWIGCVTHSPRVVCGKQDSQSHPWGT